MPKKATKKTAPPATQPAKARKPRKTAAKARKRPAAKTAAKARKRPAAKSKGFTAAEVEAIKTKVASVQAPSTAAKLALAKRAITDMEAHLEGLERDRREVRAFLRTAKRSTTKKRPASGRKRRRR